jgi:hypothetical protein
MSAIASRTLTPTAAKKSLKYCIKKKRPAFLWGPPGIGKSDIVADMCKEMGGYLIDLRLSQCDQTDLRGVPYYNKDSNKMEWAQPVDLPSEELAEQYPIIFLFLDELNSAAPSVQGAAYQLILNRQVGTYKLPDNVVIIAAGNREGDRGVAYKMPTPLANRFVHFELRVDFDSWETWAVENRIHADIVGYMNSNKGDLNDFDPKSNSKSFATPRTWTFASELLDDECDEATMTDLLSGTIGEGLALKFLAHRRIAGKLPKAMDVLTGKVTSLEVDKKEISIAYSLVASCNYELKDAYERGTKDGKLDDFHKMADNYLGFLINNMLKEVQVMAIRTAMNVLHIPFQPAKLKNFKAFFDSVGKLVVKAQQAGA